MIDAKADIARAARENGFVLTGFSALRRLPREAFYARWLAEGRAGEMGYLAREPERRFDPRHLDPRLRSVVSLAYPYRPAPAPRIDWRAELRGRIASYALGPDYHDCVLGAARAVAARLQDLSPGCVTRTYVDTGPVFEREWAAESGIGWFGRNTNTLNREHGSYFFLAEIFTDFEFDAPERPYGDYCGTCRKCLDLCPTGALAEGYLMEPRLCISYLTIELRGAIPKRLRPKLGNWIFGCDICQEVCPWNSAGDGGDSGLVPYLPDLMALDDAGFRSHFGKTAIRRAKRRGLLRNAAVALGNSGNLDAVPPLIRAVCEEPEPLVRAHAVWALGQLASAPAREALAGRRHAEPDAQVRREIEETLAAI